VMLVDQNSQTFFEVGKMYLSSWKTLTEKEKNFALTLLRKIVNRKNLDWFTELLNIWELNVKDYSLIDKISPEDELVYQSYATFLGGKSLSLIERQKYLVKAELRSWI